jgi:hypothetical protein
MQKMFCGLLLLFSIVFAQSSTCQTPLEAGVSCQAFGIQFANFESRAELMYPSNSPQKLPTVLLVHAGYPSDMDGTFIEDGTVRSKNLLTIARYLSQRGFAVARYNKRHVTTANEVDSRSYKQLGIADFVADVRTI